VYRELRRTLSTAAQEEKRFEQTQRRNLDWSQALWQQFVEAQPGLEWTPDFQTGFRDGADFYLVHGVLVTPTHPPLPYWSVAAQSPAGRAAIDEWHRGFEAGALAADQQGLREEVTLPVRVPDPDSIGRPQIMSYPGFAAAPAEAPLSPEPQDPQLLPAEPLPAASERAADPN
jgi:hypothetical protein